MGKYIYFIMYIMSKFSRFLFLIELPVIPIKPPSIFYFIRFYQSRRTNVITTPPEMRCLFYKCFKSRIIKNNFFNLILIPYNSRPIFYFIFCSALLFRIGLII